MATKKKKASAKKAAPTIAAPVGAAAKGDRKFVLDTFDQTKALVTRVEDKGRRDELAGRLKAMRAKFTALRAGKLTMERCERYMAEVTKLAREVATSKGLGPAPQ